MTQEDKELLLQDLCARLPYRVICEDEYGNVLELNSIDKPNTVTFKCSDKIFWTTDLDKCKPYLFPLSSMTDKQIMQSPTSVHVCDLENLRYDSVWTELNSRFTDLIDLIDWLNKNHFDYRGLIERGLAIDATNKNIY